MDTPLVAESQISSDISARVTVKDVWAMEATPFQPRTTQWWQLVACLPLLKLCYGYKIVRYKLSSWFSLFRVYMYTENCLVLADIQRSVTSAARA